MLVVVCWFVSCLILVSSRMEKLCFFCFISLCLFSNRVSLRCNFFCGMVSELCVSLLLKWVCVTRCSRFFVVDFGFE